MGVHYISSVQLDLFIHICLIIDVCTKRKNGKEFFSEKESWEFDMLVALIKYNHENLQVTSLQAYSLCVHCWCKFKLSWERAIIIVNLGF